MPRYPNCVVVVVWATIAVAVSACSQQDSATADVELKDVVVGDVVVELPSSIDGATLVAERIPTSTSTFGQLAIFDSESRPVCFAIGTGPEVERCSPKTTALALLLALVPGIPEDAASILEFKQILETMPEFEAVAAAIARTLQQERYLEAERSGLGFIISDQFQSLVQLGSMQRSLVVAPA